MDVTNILLRADAIVSEHPTVRSLFVFGMIAGFVEVSVVVVTIKSVGKINK